MVNAEKKLVELMDEDQLNPLPLSFFSNHSGLTQADDASVNHVEDVELLEGDNILQSNLLRYQEDFFIPQLNRESLLRKIAKGKVIGNKNSNFSTH